MSQTARQMIQELASRMGELTILSATASGAQTTIISSGVQMWFPNTITQLAHWVYCITGTAGNLGAEARVSTINVATNMLALYAPGFPVPTAAADVFELHARTRRSRKLEALNDAVGQLGLFWFREVLDESITTVANQWQYTLPAAQHWGRVSRVELQVVTNYATFPYVDAVEFNWQVHRGVDATGAETLYLQFGRQPPPGRILRVYGEAWFPDLSLDADILATSGIWDRLARTWILDWAKYRLLDETVERQPAGDSDKYRQRAQDKLIEQRDRIVQLVQSHQPGRINVPGLGSGQAVFGGREEWRWFGALGNVH